MICKEHFYIASSNNLHILEILYLPLYHTLLAVEQCASYDKTRMQIYH